MYIYIFSFRYRFKSEGPRISYKPHKRSLSRLIYGLLDTSKRRIYFLLQFLSSVLFCIVPKSLWSFMWLAITLPYQYCLSTTTLHSFVFFGFSGTASRDGFLEANREGIVSSVGYLALYFVGVQLGRILFRKRFVLFLLFLVTYNVIYSDSFICS